MDIFWNFIDSLFKPQEPSIYILAKTTCNLEVKYSLYGDIYAFWDYFEMLLNNNKIININYNGETYHNDRDTVGNLLEYLNEYEEARRDMTHFKITLGSADHPVNNIIIEIIPLMCN